ncbi:MAG: GNAT family N-acetyltransferase [Deltaproteobacteria bacterium]|nr:GNAT family N-acetyltransferase [Deltaproteobacteria bacterium]MBW2535910.1 GNAT family N-acetyltransferase [Deltaproteobacteria bacterium]
MSVQICRRIDDVDGAAWDQVVAEQTLFLQRRYLRCLEEPSGADADRRRYAIVSDDSGPLAVACFQLADFVGKPAEGWLARRSPAGALLARQLGLRDREISVRVLVCGNPFTTGEHGFGAAPGVSPARAVQAVAAAVDRLERERSEVDGYRAVLVKEFYPSTKATVRSLTSHSFSEIETAPNMVLLMDPAWRTFEGYLESLSSKFRVKAKRAYAKSGALEVRDLSAEDLRRHLPRVRELYDAVVDRAEYRLGRMPPEVLARLRRALGDELILKGYFLDGQLAGFLSGFVDGDTLEAHVVGLDYQHNRDHGIYCRMLYDYLRIALERGLQRVSYGRTADEIKSSVGAMPVSMSCYVRHRERSLNRLLPALARYVRIPSAPLREPFKKAWYAIHGSLAAQRLGLPGGASA